MQTLLQDLRYGARMLLKNPGFTLIAVITLALGIGANTAIFSVVNGVLLKPLPYAEPEQLVMVYGNFLALNATRMPASVPEFVDYKQQTRSFESIGAYDSFSANLAPNEGVEPERVEGGLLTPEIFSALKVAPFKGRVFSPEEAQEGRDGVVMLSHGLWQRRYAGDAGLIGRQISINGRALTVIGVMPPGFAFPRSAEIWRPLWFPKDQYDQQRRGARSLMVVGRMRSGVSLTAAQAEMDQLSGQLAQQYPRNYGPERRWRISLTPMQADFVGEVRRPLFVLLGAVGFVALIACANVANLLLARAVARRQELGVRVALGAKRGRIVRQLLTESLLLAMVGGAVGLLLGVWGVDLLLRVMPENLPRVNEVGVDARVLLMTSGVAVLTGVLFGLAPAFVGARIDLNETLKEGGRSGTAGSNRRRLRNAFVIGEIALALALLIGAGLTLKSFWRLQGVDTGFNPDGVLTMRTMLPNETHPQPGQRVAFYQRVLENIKGLPNVETVSAASRLPMAPGGNSGTMSGENSAVGPNDPPVEAEWALVTPDHFKALGIQILNGRAFAGTDAGGSPLVAIVDESFARRFYPNEDPIGKRIKRGRLDSQRPWLTIVGIVRHVRNQRLDVNSSVQVYFPYYQDAAFFDMALAIRVAAGDPMAVANAVRATVQSVERNQPLYRVKTMRQIVAESVSSRRLTLSLLSVFALVALALASAGIYGVMSYAAAERTHEMGIRLALGAQPRDILTMVVWQGLKLAVIGVAIGLAVALALTRLMRELIFGVEATDPMTFALLALLLIAVALLACWAPARRAAKVDPMIALRYE